MTHIEFEKVLISSWKMLENFYENPVEIDPLDYVQFCNGDGSQVLLNEDLEQNTLFIAAEFPLSLKKKWEISNSLELQTLAVVSEEISHLFHLVHAAQAETQISVFQLECIAEIDRFVSFLHWNSFCPQIPLPIQLTNCHQVCDVLFEARSFNTSNKELYHEAESFAFFHLRRAFSHLWSNREVDTSSYDPQAKKYLTQLCQPQFSLLKSA